MITKETVVESGDVPMALVLEMESKGNNHLQKDVVSSGKRLGVIPNFKARELLRKSA